MLKTDNQLDIIIYNNPKPPKYFQVNKKTINFIVFFTFFLIFSSLAYSFVYSYILKTELAKEKSKEPELIMGLNQKIKHFESQVAKLTKENQEYLAKISSGSSDVRTRIEESLTMGFFQIPLGMEDLREEKNITIENISHQFFKDKIQLKFDLLNSSQDGNKVQGFIMVTQHNPQGLTTYPATLIDPETSKAHFQRGESFGVSRFRPVIAEFPVSSMANKVWYRVAIFNRDGSLLNFFETSTYEL